ncbi:MAG: hypothetical protein NZ530_07250 [Thermodesulfobacteriaceae bacterium]|nr:hypothetical protein [Thermodesulfobacteriaceae bacterium]MCX8042343.1 hypothetical protein [Thermodesulfobacteriaceae bacterium]
MYLKLGWIFFLLLAQSSWALTLEKITSILSEKQVLISVHYKEFPFQELVLALKSQKFPIIIEYEFEIYERRLFRDLLLYKDQFYQKLYYDPEKNLYCLEDRVGIKTFEKPELAVKNLSYLDSYPLNFSPLLSKNYLKIKVRLNYFTHLSEDLKFTSKLKNKILKTEREYNF